MKRSKAKNYKIYRKDYTNYRQNIETIEKVLNCN